MAKRFKHHVNMQQGADRTETDRNYQANNDADIVRKAYEELLQKQFEVYWQNAFVGNPTPTQIQQAERIFRDNVTKARQARDRAIALLPT
jgi:hypothetical protein